LIISYSETTQKGGEIVKAKIARRIIVRHQHDIRCHTLGIKKMPPSLQKLIKKADKTLKKKGDKR